MIFIKNLLAKSTIEHHKNIILSSLENWVPSSHSKNISYHVSLIVQIKYHSKILKNN